MLLVDDKLLLELLSLLSLDLLLLWLDDSEEDIELLLEAELNPVRELEEELVEEAELLELLLLELNEERELLRLLELIEELLTLLELTEELLRLLELLGSVSEEVEETRGSVVT